MKPAREIELLWAEVRRLKQSLAKRPIKPPKGSSTALMTVTITGGNTLTTGQAGIKYSSSLITTVPSLYDPNVTSSFADGIGRGQLRINGTLQTGFYLVVNDPNSPIQRALVQNDVIAVYNTVGIPLATDPDQSVTCYVPLFL